MTMQDRQMDRLTQRLNLNTTQQSQVREILQDSQKQMMAARADKALSQQERHTKMMEIRTSSQEKIRAVLNDDQKTKYNQMQTQMQQQMQQKMQQKTKTQEGEPAPK